MMPKEAAQQGLLRRQVSEDEDQPRSVPEARQSRRTLRLRSFVQSNGSGGNEKVEAELQAELDTQSQILARPALVRKAAGCAYDWAGYERL